MVTNPVRAAETAAREDLTKLAVVLEMFGKALQTVHDAVPPSPQETSAEDLDAERLDFATELHSVVSSLLDDAVQPTVQRLFELARYRPNKGPSGRAPSAEGLDLTLGDEAMRRKLYDLVAQENFSPTIDPDSKETWVPPYTAQQAGLRIFQAFARWFAVWRKLEVGTDAPEEEEWEFLLLEPDPSEPGKIGYREI